MPYFVKLKAQASKLLRRSWNGRAKLVPEWKKLCRVRELSASRISGAVLLVVPALAATLATAESISGLSFFFPANLFITYFAFFFAYLGGIIFDVFCPNIVKLSRTYPQFFKETQLTALEVFSKHAEVKESLSEIEKELVGGGEQIAKDALLQRYAHAVQRNKLLFETDTEWSAANQKGFYARLTCTSLYGASVVLLGYLAIYDAPGRVISFLLHH
ncbi:hypothetical protein [Pseudooceanicola atlanticus]|uniref:hypothetical protein n=1 Tax=Pseudooceanicola atlanticus TaxID=1461694 RepID=UPI002356A9D6|nr:hypothetical protein [Pseudooceanicola atlanticus]